MNEESVSCRTCYRVILCVCAWSSLWHVEKRVRKPLRRITTTRNRTPTTISKMNQSSMTQKDILTTSKKKVCTCRPYGFRRHLFFLLGICLNEYVLTFLFLFLELMGDLIRLRPKETDGVESIVVVDGVPQVGSDRIEKLQNVLRKLFQKFGKITNEYYALNADGSTKG